VFANRFTALVDACCLAGTLKRNLLLTLAEADFFRLRWSQSILDETERAIERILVGRGLADAAERARRARNAMETAFEEADVGDYQSMLCACDSLLDPGDAHVLAAALKTRAAIIVTDMGLVIRSRVSRCARPASGAEPSLRRAALGLLRNRASLLGAPSRRRSVQLRLYGRPQ
jgi:predicted nucleic acid-binding protein